MGQRLRNRRVQLGFRKGAIAAHLGVSTERFEEFEAGAVQLPSVLLGKLSDLLKVPVRYFFEDMFSTATGVEPVGPEGGAASEAERLETLVNAFRALDSDKQQALLVLARAFAQDGAKAPPAEVRVVEARTGETRSLETPSVPRPALGTRAVGD
jgi:transcriptional regulator with XRE-family HTH domain